MQGQPLIKLDNISLRYGQTSVFDGASLTVRDGDFIAVSGPNGGGKTSLLRVMLRLIKPDAGRVIYYNDDHETSSLPIGYLPQKNSIDTSFPITVGEVVKSGLLSGLRTKGNRRREEELFRQAVELTGIGDWLSKPVGALSGGQLQRTLLGRAIISDPGILVLDEPLSYVDKDFEHQIYKIIERLSASKTIILVSHEMAVFSELASRHIIIDRGIRECESEHHFLISCHDNCLKAHRQ